MAKITNIDLKSLANAAHFQHIKYIIDLANVAPCITSQSLAKNCLAELNNSFVEEDRCLMLAKGSVLTEQISEADRMRDQHFITYKSMVKAMRTMPGNDLQEAAKILWRHLSDYKISTKTAIDKQTALLTNLVDDLNEKYSTQIVTLGLEELVQNMQDDNQRVEDLVRRRALETSGEPIGALRSARLATDKAYLAFLEAVDALYLVFKDPDMLKFIDDANAIINRTKSGTSRSKKKSAEAEATAVATEMPPAEE